MVGEGAPHPDRLGFNGGQKELFEMTNKKLGGNNARKWRMSVASAAVRPGKTIRALKWKLDVNGLIQPTILNNAETLYNVTEGKEAGSLSNFLFMLVVSGFRIFSSSGRAQSFANEKSLQPVAFNNAATETFGQRAKNLTSTSLLTVMTSGKRKENANFTKENIVRFLLQAAEIQANKFNAEELLDQSFEAIAEQWLAQFDSWQSLNQNLATAFDIIEERFKKVGMQSLGIAKQIDSLKEIAPKNTPIQFDERLASLINPEGLDTENLPHIAFSVAAFCDQTAQPIVAAQSGIVTDNNNALSWLFGTGLEYWQNTPVEEIMGDFEINDVYRSRIESIQKSAKAIPSNTLFTGTSYAKFRSTIGGGIASWLANYGNRLKELRQSVSAIRENPVKLPEALINPAVSRLWVGMDVDYQTLQDILIDVEADALQVEQSLNRLEGVGEFASEADIEVIELFSAKINRAGVYLNILKNRIEQMAETGTQEEKSAVISCKLEDNGAYRPMKKLNRLTGGVPKYIADGQEMLQHYNALQQTMRTHFGKIKAFVEKGESFNTVSRIQRQIEKKAEKINKKTPVDANLQARLKMLDRIGNAARVCSEETVRRTAAWFEHYGFFKYTVQLHKYLFNRRGQIVHNAHAKTRHEGYEMNYEAIRKSYIEKAINDLVNEMKKHAFENIALMKDFHQVERAWFNLQLSGIDENIPSDIAKPAVDDEHIPMGMQLLLQRGEVSGPITQKLFNIYHSLLNDMATKLFREEFTIKMRFQQVGDNALIYRPKDVEWQPPKHIFETDNPLRDALESCGFVAGGKKSVKESITQLANKQKEKWVITNPVVTGLLSQSPHDWYFNTGIQGVDTPIEGVQVSKDGLGQYRAAAGVRLIGPSSYKADLLAALKGEKGIGDITLIIERVFRQHITLHPDGSISMETHEMPSEWWLVTPINQPENLKLEAPSWMNRIVSIDLGERGLGYAVFDLESGTAVTDANGTPVSGTKVIRSIKELGKAAYRYKATNQKRQKFSQAFDTRMLGHRKNVVGDVCHVINDLCARFDAFPVLESRVGKYETGAGQIELVYNDVTARYLFSDIDADKSLRKAYWMGSDRWLHPTLKRKTMVDGKEVVKPLNIFPGAGVNPAGTSQECSCCGRNAIKTIRDSKQTEFAVNEHGIVQLDNGMVVLKQLEPMSKEHALRLAREIRHQKKRPQLSAPVQQSTLDKDELIKIVRNNMRRAPVDTRSKDTTQSRYICVYADCGKTRHADENAAINIGKRFVESLV